MHKRLVAGLSRLVTCLQSNFIGTNFTGFCSNLGVLGLFSSPFVCYWVHIDWLAPGYLMGAGNPTISRETETQVRAACQPRQPHSSDFKKIKLVLILLAWSGVACLQAGKCTFLNHLVLSPPLPYIPHSLSYDWGDTVLQSQKVTGLGPRAALITSPCAWAQRLAGELQSSCSLAMGSSKSR